MNRCTWHYNSVTQWREDTGLQYDGSLRCPRDAVFSVDLLRSANMPDTEKTTHELCGTHTIEWALIMTQDTE